MNQSNLVQQLVSVRNLLQNNTIGIVLGERLNLDTAAAGLALYLSLTEAGKKPQIISKKEPTVEISNLVGINKLKKSFSGDSSRVVVSLPYNRGEIGKVSYKEENDRINFYLTAAEGRSITPYETDDINLIWEGVMPGVIIAFGVTNPSQLADLIGQNGESVKVINVDNTGESFGDISIVDNSFSSTSEIAAKIIKEIKLPVNIDVAQNLLDGILYSTKNFTKPNSSPFAFEATGLLMQAGAVRADNRNSGKGMFNQNQQQQKPRDKFQNQQGRHQNQNKQKREEFFKNQEQQNKNSQNEALENNQNGQAQEENQDIPSDWLEPKVFTGSQDIDDLK